MHSHMVVIRGLSLLEREIIAFTVAIKNSPKTDLKPLKTQ